MTRATDKPVRRVVSGQSHGELVVEVTRETLQLRLLRTRKRYEVPWGAVLLRAVQDMVDAERRAKRKHKQRRTPRGSRF